MRRFVSVMVAAVMVLGLGTVGYAWDEQDVIAKRGQAGGEMWDYIIDRPTEYANINTMYGKVVSVDVGFDLWLEENYDTGGFMAQDMQDAFDAIQNAWGALEGHDADYALAEEAWENGLCMQAAEEWDEAYAEFSTAYVKALSANTNFISHIEGYLNTAFNEASIVNGQIGDFYVYPFER